jgi:hypothetical protein
MVGLCIGRTSRKLLASVSNRDKMITINKWVVVEGAVVTLDAMNELTVNGLVKGEVVIPENTVALLIIVVLESMARWQKMMATSLPVEYLLRH